MKEIRPQLLVLLLGVMIALLTGCGVETINEKVDVTGDMTEQQALARIDQHIADAIISLPIATRLEEIPPRLTVPCGPWDNLQATGPREMIMVSKDYWMRELSPERTNEVFDVMHSYWLSHDYRVLRDRRGSALPSMLVESNSDAFRMSLDVNLQGDLGISAISPCLWPEGTP